MGEVYLNKKPVVEEYEYAYVETADGAITKVPRNKIYPYVPASKEDVGKLSQEIDNQAKSENTTLRVYATLAQGALNQGEFWESSKHRVSTVEKIAFSNDVFISIADGYKIGVISFVNSGIVDSGWKTGVYKISANTVCRIQIAKSTEDYTEADVDMFVNAVLVSSYSGLQTRIIKNSSVDVYVSQGKNVTFANGSDFFVNVSIDTNRLFFYGLDAKEIYHDYDANISFGLSNNYVAIVNLETYEIETVHAENLRNVLYPYTILCKNHYGVILGQFSRYYYHNISMNGISKLRDDNTSAINKLRDDNTSAINKLRGTNSNSTYKIICREGSLNGVPINSIYGCIEAKKYGYDAMRVDIRVTSDGVFVLEHDETINAKARNVDGTELTSDVYVASNTLAELNAYDFGIRYGSQYSGLKITELDEFLNKCALLGLTPVLELKVSFTDEQITSLCKVISKYGLGTNVWISDDHISNLDRITELLPYVNIAYIHKFNADGVNIAKNYVSDKHKTRIDSYASDDFNNEDLMFECASNGIEVKVGSAYNSAEFLSFANKGVQWLECAYLLYPKEILANSVTA